MSKSLQSSINGLMKKYVPKDYFRKFVFRVAIVLCVVVWFLALASNGWSLKGSYRVCGDGPPCVDYIYDPLCPQSNPFCEPVEVRRMLPNTVVGDVPSEFSQRAGIIMFGILVSAFSLNHLLYLYRRRNGK